MFFSRTAVVEPQVQAQLICPECGQAVEANALFCRHCLAGLPAWEAYADEHFQGIRGWTKLMLDQQVSPDEFIENLRPYANNLMDSLQVIEVIPPAQLDEEVRHTESALRQFLEGLEVIASFTLNHDLATLLDGLQITESANHALNGVLVEVAHEEIFPGSLVDVVA